MPPYEYEPWAGSIRTPFEVTALVTLTLNSGDTLVFEGVRPESIGPSGVERDVIGIEFDGSDRLVHVPFVRFWEVSYR